MCISEISKSKRNLLGDLIKDLKRFLHKDINSKSFENILDTYRASQPMVEGAPIIEGYVFQGSDTECTSIKLYLYGPSSSNCIFSQTLEVK